MEPKENGELIKPNLELSGILKEITTPTLTHQFNFDLCGLEKLRQRKSLQVLIAENKTEARDFLKKGCGAIFTHLHLKPPMITTINAIEKIPLIPKSSQFDLVITDWHLGYKEEERILSTAIQYHQESNPERRTGTAVECLQELLKNGLISQKTTIVIQSGVGRKELTELFDQERREREFEIHSPIDFRTKPAQPNLRWGINMNLFGLALLSQKKKHNETLQHFK